MNAGLRPEALAGRWEAVIADTYGWVTSLDEVARGDDAAGEFRIAIVRGSAAPTGPDVDGMRRLPGSYKGDDHLVEWLGLEDYDEITARWVQAEAMAAGLNAARDT